MTQLGTPLALLPPAGAVPFAAQLLRNDEARLNPPPALPHEQRAQFVDFAIAQNRANVPDAIKRIIAERRQTTRLTIRDIHGLSEDTLRGIMEPRHDTDFRSPIVRVLDVIDLPRNSIANVAFGDPSALGLLGGLAETAGLFAGAGAIFGSFVGPLGAGGGAVAGAIGGTAVFLVGTALAGIARAFGGDELLEQRLDLLERGAFGQPKLFASDVLEQLGVENKVVRAIVGFGGDVLLDPLTYLGGGGSAIRLTSVGGGKGVHLFLRSPARRVLGEIAEETLAAGPRVGQAIGSSHPLAVLFEKSESFGNFFSDSTNQVNRLGELLASSRENFASFNAGIIEAVSFRKNQKVITNQLLQEIAFFAGTDLTGRPVLDLLKQKAAQEFVREFAQRSALNISFPFAGMIANRFHSVLGGRSLTIPVGRVGKPGVISKALGETQEAFVARQIADAREAVTTATRERQALTAGVTLTGVSSPDIVHALPVEFQDEATRLIPKEVVSPSITRVEYDQQRVERLGLEFSQTDTLENEVGDIIGAVLVVRDSEIVGVKATVNAPSGAVTHELEHAALGLKYISGIGEGVLEAELNPLLQAISDILNVDSGTGLGKPGLTRVLIKLRQEVSGQLQIPHDLSYWIGTETELTRTALHIWINGTDVHREAIRRAAPAFAKDLAAVDPTDLVSFEKFAAQQAVGTTVAPTPISLPLHSVSPGLREVLRSVHKFEVVSPRDLDLGRVDELTRTIRQFDEVDRIEQISQQQVELVHFTAAIKEEEKLLGRLKNAETDPDNLSVFFDKANENLGRLIGSQQLTHQELYRLMNPQVITALNAADNVVSASSRGDMLTSYRGFSGAFRRMFSDRFSKIDALYRSKESVSNIANLKARNYVIGKDEAIKRLKILDPEGTGIKAVNNLTVKMDDIYTEIHTINTAKILSLLGSDLPTVVPTIPRILATLPTDIPYRAPTGETIILNFENPLDHYAWLLRRSDRPKDTLSKARRKEAKLYLRRVFGADPMKKGAKARKAGTIDPDEIAEKVLAEVESIFGAVTKGRKATKAKKVGEAAEEFGEVVNIPASDSALNRRNNPLSTNQFTNITDETNLQLQEVRSSLKAAMVIEDDVVLAQTSIRALDDAADVELAGLTGQIEELEGQLFWRTTARLADIQGSLRDALNIGRKLTGANEPIRVFRVANENVLPQKNAELTRSFNARIRSLHKTMGGRIPADDLSLAVQWKIMEKIERESAALVAADPTGGHVAKRGFPRNHDIFIDEFEKRVLNNPEYHTPDGHVILDSPELDALVGEGIILLKMMDNVEIEVGVRARDFDATWVYLPLRLAEKAREVARRLGIEAGELSQIAGTTGRRLSTSQPANLRRLTNRRPYPGDVDPRAKTPGREGTNFIYEGELMNMGDPGKVDTKFPYERERQIYVDLNFDQDTMFPGDLWDKGFKSNPRADRFGERWQPNAYATSPQELNLKRHDFMRRVGEEITGPIFETDFLIALAARQGEHLRAISSANLAHMVAPHTRTVRLDRMKFLPKGSIGNTKVIDGVEMRAINPKKIGTQNLLKIPLPKDPPGSVVLWPEDLASAIEDFAQHYRTEADINNLLRAMDFTLMGWKMSVLLKPAWAMVNIIGGAVLAGLAGIRFNEVPKLMSQLTALNLKVHGLNKQSFNFTPNIPVGNQLLSEHSIWEQAVEDGIASASRTTQELVPWMQMGTPESKTFFGTLFHGDEKHQGKWYMRVIGKWFQVNAALDDQWRLATWVDLRNQGFSRADATSQVHRYLFDWGDFTRTEREWGPRVWPFYRWMRSNIAIQMKTVLEKPQFAAAFPKVLEALEEGLVDEEAIPPHLRPRWMRDAMAIHISANPKQARFLLMGSLTPAQEIFEIGAGVMGQEGFGDFMNYFVSSSNPLVKSAFEIAGGINIFTGQGIGDVAMGETSVAEHLGRQTGTIGSLFRGVFHPVSTVERIIDDPVRETIRFLVGGRFQQKDISALVAQKRFEEGETIDTLRASIKRARRDDDTEEAERLARIAIDRYHQMYNLGYVDFPPKFLQAVFRREQFLKNQRKNHLELPSLPAV